MTVELLLGLLSAAVTITVALFVFVPAINRSRTEARVADVDARVSEVDVDDKIAARRLSEITHLSEDLQKLRDEFQAFKDRSVERDTAMANVLRDASEQWPENTHGPVFDPNDIKVLSDTIPPRWRKRPRQRTT